MISSKKGYKIHVKQTGKGKILKMSFLDKIIMIKL